MAAVELARRGALAQQPRAPSSRTRGATPVSALVVGVSYDASPENRLANAVNDASDFASKLLSLGHNVQLVTEPKLEDFARAMDRYLQQLTFTKHAFFYFSGHGIQIERVNYLVMADVNTLVSVQQLIDLVRPRVSGTTFILDACRNNPLPPPGGFGVVVPRDQGLTRSVSPVHLQDLAAATSRGLAEMSIRGRGVKIVFSTDPGNVAADGDGRNSPFNAALVRRLGERKSFDEVLSEVTREVDEVTNGSQTPWQQGSTDEVVYLVGRPASFETGANRMPIP